jgi:hypothetical protein
MCFFEFLNINLKCLKINLKCPKINLKCPKINLKCRVAKKLGDCSVQLLGGDSLQKTTPQL